jgi:hypothetical protein
MSSIRNSVASAAPRAPVIAMAVLPRLLEPVQKRRKLVSGTLQNREQVVD